MAITKVSGDRVPPSSLANYRRPFWGFTQPLSLLGSDVVEWKSNSAGLVHETATERALSIL